MCCINGFNTTSLNKAAHEAAMILNEIYAPMLNLKMLLRIEIENMNVEFGLVQCEIDTIRVDIATIIQRPYRHMRVLKRTNISIDNDEFRF